MKSRPEGASFAGANEVAGWAGWYCWANESGHAAEEEGEHVQVGEAGKINNAGEVRGGLAK